MARRTVTLRTQSPENGYPLYGRLQRCPNLREERFEEAATQTKFVPKIDDSAQIALQPRIDDKINLNLEIGVDANQYSVSRV